MKGLAFALPFWRWWKIRRKGGRRQDAKRPKKRGARGPLAPGPLFCLAAPGRPTGPPRACQTPPPPVTAPSFLRLRATAVGPPGPRCPRVGGWRQGRAGGAAAFGGRGPTGPPACQTKERRPGQRPGPPLFQGASRPRRPPGGTLGSFPPFRTKRLFFRSFSYKQNPRAAPDERPAGIIRWKPGKVIQLVFPRFFQKRAKGLGAEPPTGSGAEPRRQIPYPNALRKSPTLRRGPRRG